MTTKKRCGNCKHPDYSKGYMGCAPMDYLPVNDNATCVRWDEREYDIPADLLGEDEVAAPAAEEALYPVPEEVIQETAAAIIDAGVLDEQTSPIVEELSGTIAVDIPPHTEIKHYTPSNPGVKKLLTLTYRGCSLAVPFEDTLLNVRKKFEQFIDKHVMS